MRRLAILTFQSLDGVMQAHSCSDEDHSDGFDLGGWAQPFLAEVMAQVRSEAMAAPYEFLYGRKTYDLFSKHWQTADPDDPATQTVNKANKFVVTSRIGDLGWSNVHRIDGDLLAAITELKAQKGLLLQVNGSWHLIQQLVALDLIDEFRLWTYPVLVGRGKRLFQDGNYLNDLQLAKSGSLPNGVTMHFYERDQQ